MSVLGVNNDYVKLTYQIRELYLPDDARMEMFNLKGILAYVAAGGDYPSDPYRYGLRKQLDVIAAELGCDKEFFKRHYKALKSMGLVHTKAITKTGRVRWVDRQAVEHLWAIQAWHKHQFLDAQKDLDEDEIEEDPSETVVWDCPTELRLLQTASLPFKTAEIDALLTALKNRTVEPHLYNSTGETNSVEEQSESNWSTAQSDVQPEEHSERSTERGISDDQYNGQSQHSADPDTSTEF